LTRSPALGSEVAIPCLQKLLLMFRGKCLQSAELPRWKSKIECQPDRLQPEFCRQVVTINVHVRRLM
jgi:hypothetical protein